MSEGAGAVAREAFALSTFRGFPAWLGEARASLAFTTYQAGKLFGPVASAMALTFTGR